MSLRTFSLITHPAYLRHVEEALGEVTHVDGLKPADVPAHRPRLSKISDIGNYLDVSPEIIRSIIRAKETHYREFEFNKKSGGKRTISAPRTFLKVIQWWILDTILSNTYSPEFIFGFVRGRSYIDNAKAHVGSRHFLNVDVKDFFGSLTSDDIHREFVGLGYGVPVARGLSELTTLRGALPQGAPTSPTLSNLAFQRADIRLKQLSEGIGAIYTRYADDLTFSSVDRIDSRILTEIKGILASIGLELNDKKTRFMGPNQRCEITGLTIGKDGVCLSRDFLNGARGWFYKVNRQPTEYLEDLDRIVGTAELIKQVGGRGTGQVVVLANQAINSVKDKRSAENVVTLFPINP